MGLRTCLTVKDVDPSIVADERKVAEVAEMIFRCTRLIVVYFGI